MRYLVTGGAGFIGSHINVPDPVFAEPRAGDIYRSVGSPDYTAQTIDFRSEVSLEEGLKDIVAWMQA